MLGVAMLAGKGILTQRHLYFDLIGLPAAALGIGLGVAIYNRLDQRVFGRIVVVALFLTGVGYIGTSAAELLAPKVEHTRPTWRTQHARLGSDS